MSAAGEDALFPERFVPGEMRGLIEVEHMSRYWWASTHVEARRVLDAGCGLGYGSRLLAGAGAASVTGVDISQEAIAHASETAAERVAFNVGDLAELPFADDSFDLVVCFETIEHVEDQARALDELRRVLGSDGLLLISSPNRGVYQEGNPFHTHEYTPEELQLALGARFAQVRLERQATWLTSMICEDELLVASDPALALALDVRKLAALAPGAETFTLAFASDAELPGARGLAMLTVADELETWRERARSAERHAELAREAGVEAASSYRSLEETYHSLQETYQAATRNYENALEHHAANAVAQETKHDEQQRALREEQAAELAAAAERQRELEGRARDLEGRVRELERERDAANAALATIRGSLAWRASGPLRALARRGRS